MAEVSDCGIKTAKDLVQFETGEIIAEKYQVIERFWRQDDSYLCKRLTPPFEGALAKIKLFSGSRFNEDEKIGLRRFQHQIVAATKIRHPRVERVDELINVDGVLGFVSEYLSGDPLDLLLADSEPMPLDKVVLLLKQICEGAAAIHQQGVIHRNIKPKNILVNEELFAKIVDFGTVRLTKQKRLTSTSNRLGTIDYMSPEYITDNIITPGFDIFSIGIVGYQLLTKRIPHNCADSVAMLQARVETPAESPIKYRPDCPVELASIILKALERDCQSRYQSAKEMLSDLKKLTCIESLPIPKAPKPIVVPHIEERSITAKPARNEARYSTKLITGFRNLIK